MLDQNDPNITHESSWLNANNYKDKDGNDECAVISFNENEIDTSAFVKWSDDKYSIPNMLYSPENIFAGNIATLDINFLNPNTYASIYVEGENDFQNDATEKAQSATALMQTKIANWYRAFRDIAIVGLLSVLIYLGIRILISSTAADKAKYKENIKNWVVALCLVFVIHFIMSGILMITDKCTELFDGSVKGYNVYVANNEPFHTNLMGLVRFQAQSSEATTAAAYTILYLALIIYTCMFTIMYLKRFFYMAFFTMIAPLVSLTYPIDKVGDGKAQAFNLWFKEYTMNAVIQPVHLILYSLFVGMSAEMAATNPLYALVAMGFLIPAETFIKKMFGIDKSQTAGGIGSFAGGALAMAGLQRLSGMGKGLGAKGSGKGKGGADGDDAGKGIWMKDNNLGKLKTFGGDKEGKEGKDGIGDGIAGGGINLDKREGNEDSTIPKLTDDERDELGQLRDEMDNTTNENAYRQGYEWEAKKDRLAELERKETITQGQGGLGLDKSESVGKAKSENSGAKQPIKGYRRRVAGRAFKTVGRGLWNNRRKIARATLGTGARIAGMGIGATVAAAATVASGGKDPVKTMTTGLVSGAALGAGAYNLGESAVIGATSLGRGISNTAKDARYAYEEEKYGYEYAREQERKRQNKAARKDFLKNDKERRKYRELAAKMKSKDGKTYEGKLEDLMNAAADYKEAGVKDDKLITQALEAEYKRDKTLSGTTHDQFVDLATFADKKGIGAGGIEDKDELNKVDNLIGNTVKDEKTGREIALMYADIFKKRDIYEKHGRYGKTALAKNTSKPKK